MPTLLIAVFGFYGYLAYRPELLTKRPSAPAQFGDVAGRSVTDINVVDARLWEDPLGEKYAKQYERVGRSMSNTDGDLNDPSVDSREKTEYLLQQIFRQLGLPSTTLEDGIADKPADGPPVETESRADRTALATSSIATGDSSQVLILPIFVPGGEDPAVRDQRLRTRYALVSALTTGGYRAVLGHRIGYITVQLGTEGGKPSPSESASEGKSSTPKSASEGTEKTVVVGLEMFVPDVVDRFYDEDDFGRFKTIVLCWMDENRWGSYALRGAGAVFKMLGAETHANWTLRMIGPSTSDGLLSMAKEARLMEQRQQVLVARKPDKEKSPTPQTTEVGTDANADPNSVATAPAGDRSEKTVDTSPPAAGDNQTAVANLPPHIAVELYSSRATLPVERLKGNRDDELVEGYSVEALLQNFVTPDKQREKPDDGEEDFSNIGTSIGLKVYRTIGNDEQLVKKLREELVLRNCWPREINWPHEHDPYECTVLLTERDTLYGRMLPKLFSNELRKRWSFDATQVQPGNADYYDFVINDGKRTSADIFVRLALTRDEATNKDFIRNGELIIGRQSKRRAGQRTNYENIDQVDKRWVIDGYKLATAIVRRQQAGTRMTKPPADKTATQSVAGDGSDAAGRAVARQLDRFAGTWEISVSDGKKSYAAKFVVSRVLDKDGRETDKLKGQWRLPAPLLVYKYLSGIDGRLASKDIAVDAERGPNKRPSDLVSGYEPQGASQLDYLRRMENELAELNDWQLEHGGRGIISIGVVGSDVYDKLLLMRALNQRFPNTCFFTTDLDANFARPSEISHTRNLVVAAHYGLELHPSLQRGVPAFRHSYQTSMFFTALLAMEDPRALNVLNGKEAWQLWYEPNKRENPSGDSQVDEKRTALEPLIFEISNVGPYQITKTLGEDEKAKLISPVASVHPRPDHVPMSRVVHPPSPRDIERWTFSRAVFLMLMTGAISVVLALNLTAAARMLVSVVSSVGRVLRWMAALTFSIVVHPLAIIVASLTSSDRQPLSSTPPWYMRYAPAFPKWRDAAIAMSALVPLAVLYLIVWDHRSIDGEPFEFLSGISVWPSTLIRMVAAIISVAFIWNGIKQLNDTDREVARVLLGYDDDDANNPCNWQINDWWRSEWVRWTWRIWRCGGNFRSWRMVTAAIWKRVYLYDWHVPGDRIEHVLRHYIRKGRPWARLVRIAVLSILFGVFAVSLFGFSQYRVNSPHRGEFAGWLSYIVWLIATVAMVTIVFFVVDATHLCQRFTKVFQQRRIRWPDELLGTTAADYHLVDKDDLCDFMAVQIIAERSNQVGKLLYYPCSVLLLMVFARLQTFDRWSLPLPLMIVLGLLLLALILHSLVLRRVAKDTKAEILARLLASRSRLATVTPKSQREIRQEQLNIITAEVENERRGAFRSLSEDDLLKAFAVPFGGTGGLLLLEQIMT